MSDIKWFHTQLKEAIDTNKMTIKGFCELVDLNYLKILNVLRGEDLLEKDVFDKICQSSCFSKNELDGLKEAFSHVHISKDERKKIEAIVRVLNSLYETVTEKSSFGHGLIAHESTSK